MKAMLIFVLGVMMSGASFAADTGPVAPAPVDKEMQAARAQIAKKDWTAAVATLEPYTKANAKSADGFNLLGYSYRNLKRYDESLVAYKQALTLDPKHRGAHEYIGIAYIHMGQPAKAREHLAALDKICTFSCEEYRDLKKALERVK
jgi:cytochrome c-type biogenesis protein CcmH/NrfG